MKVDSWLSTAFFIQQYFRSIIIGEAICGHFHAAN